VSELPAGWQQVSMSELGKVVSGGTPSTKEADYWGGEVVWLSPADLTGYSKKYIKSGAKHLTTLGLKNSSATLIPAGSIAFSSRAPIGYVVITSVESSTNQGFKSLVPHNGVDKEYIYYYLKASKQLAEEHASGTTFKELSGKAFSALPVPLPPTDEQRRIVTQVEILFGEVNQGAATLKHARAQLVLYRQSVLKNAFEGHLTASWRADNPDQLEGAQELLERIYAEHAAWYATEIARWEGAMSAWKEAINEGRLPIKPKPFSKEILPHYEVGSQEAKTPQEWTWLQAGTFSIISGGLTKNQRREALPMKMKYLRVANVYENELRLGEISKIGVSLEEFKKVRLSAGDLLVVEGNGSIEQIGRAAIWPGHIEDVGHQNHLIRVRFVGNMIPKFFLYFLMSPVGRQLVKKKANSTSGLHTLSIKKISDIPLPIASAAEQLEIVRQLEAKLSTIDALEAEIDTQLARADALRQSILKKAFSGQLVPQDPTDEPASVLLERIRAERAAEPARPRRKKRA